MRRLLLSALLFAIACARAKATCFDPAALASSTVGITREFGEEQRAKSGVAGIGGSAWFLSPRSMVTAAHVADAMKLSAAAWTEVLVGDRRSGQAMPVRIERIVGGDAERLAVLELRAPFPGATALTIRSEPLASDEPVVALAYPGGRQRKAVGRFIELGKDSRTAGMALLEMHDGEDRLVLDHGASGAPVLDCTGRVVAVVANVFSQTLKFQSQVIRVSTPWQSPNVAAIPAVVLMSHSPPR